MPLRKGGDKGEEAAKRQTGPRSLVRYLTQEATLKDAGDKAVIRPLTEQDEWIYVDVHRFVPTKTAPADHKGNWPKKMSAVCQNDEGFKDESTGQYLPGYGDCYICKAPQYQVQDQFKKLLSKPSLRGYMLAVLREVDTEGTKIVGAHDLAVEVKIGEETKKVRNIVVVEAAQSNFFANLNGYFAEYGTVRDRDYIVRVQGEGPDKNFLFIPLTPIPDHVPGSASWAKYDESMKEQGLDLETIVVDKSTQEYYKRWFIPAAGEEAAEVETLPSAPAAPDADALAALEARISSYAPKPAA